MALPTRLMSTCRSRIGSPRTTAGTAGSIDAAQLQALRCARAAPRSRSSPRSISRKPNSMRSSSSLPASIFEKSRMSLMISQQSLGGARDGLREAPLPRRELGALQELRHAHDAVHRACGSRGSCARGTRSSRCSRARQPPWPPSPRRSPACSSRLALPRLIGALGDLLLEELPIALQTRIALANLAEHLVEAVDQRADLVLGAALHAQACNPPPSDTRFMVCARFTMGPDICCCSRAATQYER